MALAMTQDTPSLPVVIADYDPLWPAMFAEESALVLDAIGEWLLGIEHVGSTSVPGLAAKPVVDMMPGLRSLDDSPYIVGPLQKLVEPTSAFWRRHLGFRDYLRAHPDAAAEYAALKRRLAAEYGTDRVGYTDAKTDFITRIESLALAGEAG